MNRVTSAPSRSSGGVPLLSADGTPHREGSTVVVPLPRTRAASSPSTTVLISPTLPLRESTRCPRPSRSMPPAQPRADDPKTESPRSGAEPFAVLSSSSSSTASVYPKKSNVPYGSTASLGNAAQTDSGVWRSQSSWLDLDHPHNPLRCNVDHQRDEEMLSMKPHSVAVHRTASAAAEPQLPSLVLPENTAGAALPDDEKKSGTREALREPTTRATSATSRSIRWPTTSAGHLTPMKQGKWWQTVVCLSKRRSAPDPFFPATGHYQVSQGNMKRSV